MSRLGKLPVSVPSGVKVEKVDRTLRMTGPKGEISWEHHRLVGVAVDGDQITVTCSSKVKLARALHGTTRQLIRNMVVGVHEGFLRELEIVGVGYNAKVQGKSLVLQIGFCHPVELTIPDGVEVEVPRPTQIAIRGVDKQKVGQFAANIRRVRPPEPYKGKGILYKGEVIRRKAAKSFGSA